MRATLIERQLGGYCWALQLWTGERLTVRRAEIPIKGVLNIGNELEVVVKPVPVLRARRRFSDAPDTVPDAYRTL
jgi:hypothetical protein